VDRHPRMAGGQGLQPLVTPSRSGPGRLLPTGLSDCGTLAILLGNPRHCSTRHGSTRQARSAQSGLGARCATEWIASPRSVSLASCS
jgi:hypothetical protein